MTDSGRPRLRVVSDDRVKVTQEELRRLRNLRNDADALKMEADRIELAILERLAAGELVESGPLQALPVRTVVQIVDEDVIRVVQGLEVLEAMRTRVEPTCVRSLKIIPVKNVGNVHA